MSARRCFDIPELLEKIVYEVSKSSARYFSSDTRCIDMKDVLSLVTVSQSFSKHALDVLWCNIADIQPFECVLPLGLVVVPEFGTDDDKVPLTAVSLRLENVMHCTYRSSLSLGR